MLRAAAAVCGARRPATEGKGCSFNFRALSCRQSRGAYKLRGVVLWTDWGFGDADVAENKKVLMKSRWAKDSEGHLCL